MNNKILIIKLGALGDLILLAPFIRSVQQAHAGTAICLLTTPPFAHLFDDWPELTVHALERRDILKMVLWVRRQGFRRIYDFQSNDRSAVVCALSGVPERIGERPRFPYTHHPPGPYNKQTHVFQRHNALLISAGLEPAEECLCLPIPDCARAEIKAWIIEHGLDKRAFALCHAGASVHWPSKRWPYFAELAEQLADNGITIVWLGSGSDAQTNRVLAGKYGIDATDNFRIFELAELGRYARFAVTNDSAPMHVLAGTDIPVYGLFGPTDWRRSHALGQSEQALYSTVTCPACASKHKALAEGHSCLASISVDRVMQRLDADGLLNPDRHSGR